MKQSSKAGTIKTTNPQSVQPITAVDQITEDASSWNTVNGAKQSRGFAYCDGSTLTNVGGIYDDFVAAHGSLVLPNGPFKTRQLGFTLGSPTTSNPIQITSPTETGMVLSDDLLFAHSDTEGNWFLTFALRLTFNARNDNNWDFTFSDIDVITTPVSSVVNSFVATQASISATSQLLRIYSSSSFSNDTIRVSGTVPLNSKPTWADANLESYPVIALQNNVAANALGLPEASASQSGTVTLDQVAEAGRNYIINGAFDIWQRGVGPFTNNYYDSDRWLSSSVGSSHSTNQESFTLGQSAVEGSPKFFYSNTVTTGSLSSHFTVSQQRIEGVDSLNNQTAVLSFYAKADGNKPMAVEFTQSFGSGGSPSSTVTAIGVQKINLTTSWQRFTVTANIPSMTGKMFFHVKTVTGTGRI